jgi:predicted unusual protein kinase regulating ubiquinone biosynthesis (AarF/ABC1/UbiB family)
VTAKPTAARRALRLARLGAGVSGSYAGYLLQRVFLTEAGAARALKRAHATAGRKLRDEMGALRGPAMKLGQALSLHGDVLPEEIIRELTSLQLAAPPMHPSLVRAQFRASLGRAPEDVYASFEAEPFAAASLGQVHRAVLRDARLVAVKIQYPGIQDAVANDFRWFRAVSKPAQASGHLPVSAIDELEAQIGAETDYRQEAANLAFFAPRLTPLGYATIPTAVGDLSTDRVLTMTRVEGEHLDAFLARRPSQATRDLVGARLFELFYFQVLRVQALHADPHWGNYLFRHDGSIGIVDFGCVKRLEPAFVDGLRQSYLYEGPRDSPAFQRLLRRYYTPHGLTLRPAAMKALMHFSERFYAVVYPPREDAPPFDFGDAAFMNAYIRESQALLRTKGMLPDYLMMARAELGLYSTLLRLKARVPTSAIVRRWQRAR